MSNARKNIESVKKDNNKVLRKTAEKGDADAQYRLGSWYYDGGDGISCANTSDRDEAIKWFRKAAGQEHVEAQFILGFCYK